MIRVTACLSGKPLSDPSLLPSTFIKMYPSRSDGAPDIVTSIPASQPAPGNAVHRLCSLPTVLHKHGDAPNTRVPGCPTGRNLLRVDVFRQTYLRKSVNLANFSVHLGYHVRPSLSAWYNIRKKYTPAVRSKIPSKFISACCVRYNDRAYYWVCVVNKDCCCCCCCSHINSHNQVRGHRTGSSHSGTEEYPQQKNTNKPKVVHAHITADAIHASARNI